jgi:hypothetical protein
MNKQELKSIVRLSVLLIAASTFELTGCVMLDALALAGGYQPPPPNTAYVPPSNAAYSPGVVGVYSTYVPPIPLNRPYAPTSNSCAGIPNCSGH